MHIHTPIHIFTPNVRILYITYAHSSFVSQSGFSLLGLGKLRHCNSNCVNLSVWEQTMNTTEQNSQKQIYHLLPANDFLV